MTEDTDKNGQINVRVSSKTHQKWKQKFGKRDGADALRPLIESLLDGKSNLNGGLPDFSHIGLVGLIPNFEQHDFSSILFNAETLWIYGRNLSVFMSNYGHGDQIAGRSHYTDKITYVSFARDRFFPENKPFLDRFNAVHLESMVHAKQHAKGEFCVSLSDEDPDHYPYFILIVDGIAYASIGRHQSPSYALKWIETSPGDFYCMLEQYVLNNMHGEL